MSPSGKAATALDIQIKSKFAQQQLPDLIEMLKCV
jgi:hypothetical protein